MDTLNRYGSCTLIVWLVFLVAHQTATSQIDTTQPTVEVVLVETRGKVFDVDDDGVADTLTMRERQWVHDGVIRRRRQIPLRILWGVDTSAKRQVADTTVLTLPFPASSKVSTSFYDADSDGLRDIVVSWWWADSTTGRTKDRVLAFRGGADLRGERHLVMASRQDIPDKDYVIRLDRSDEVAGAQVSHGGLLLRERPMVPQTKPKKAPEPMTAEVALKPSLHVYPNPAHTNVMLTVTCAEDLAALPAEIIMVDRRGALLLREPLRMQDLTAGRRLDVSQMAQGAYTVVVLVDGAAVTESACIIQR